MFGELEFHTNNEIKPSIDEENLLIIFYFLDQMKERFSLIDYGVFSAMLVISASIGLYFAFKERHKKKISEVLLGDRKLKIFPVAMSIMASFTSVIFLLNKFLTFFKLFKIIFDIIEGNIYSRIFSRNVFVWYNVCIDWRIIFFHPAVCCSHLCSFFP